MHTLIVVAHPDPHSLTHAIAARVRDGITHADPTGTVALADLAAEGFDPRFNPADLAQFNNRGDSPADVLAEQQRLDRAAALVLVYPIYWWSFPALLKGWIDRVFTQGWGYRETPEGKVGKLLQRLPVHLVGNGGADEGMMQRHGYFKAMQTQIDHGIFDYCGAPVRGSHFLLASDPGFPAAHLERAFTIGQGIPSASA